MPRGGRVFLSVSRSRGFAAYACLKPAKGLGESRVDKSGGWRGLLNLRGRSGGLALRLWQGALKEPQLGDGPIAEIHVYPLKNLLGTVLELDGAGTIDLEHENGAIVPPGALGRGGLPILGSPRPHELVRRREARQLIADDRRPFAQERSDGKAARPCDWVEHARRLPWRRSRP